MNAAFTAILSLLSVIAPLVSDSSKVTTVVKALGDLIPVIVKEFNDLVPIVKDIIAVLKGNSAVTSDQMAQLEVLEAQLDQDFENAANDAQKEDSQ